MTANTALIKTPYIQEKLSAEDLKELARCTLSPEYFIRKYCYIQHPTKGKMKLDIFDYQEGLIDSYHNYRYSISLLPRQTGKALDIETDILTPHGFVKMKDFFFSKV